MLNTQETVLNLVNSHIDALTEKKKESFLSLYDFRKNRKATEDKEMVYFNPLFNGMAWIGKSDRGGYAAIAYSGRRKKPDFFFRYPTKEDAQEKLKTWSQNKEKIAQMKKDEKDKEKELNKKIMEFVKVGDIFEASWGYEQTNVDYYQLVGLKGKRTGIFRKISGEIIEHCQGFAGKIIPRPNDFIGEEFEKKLTASQWGENSPVDVSFKDRSYSRATLERPNKDGSYTPSHVSWGY